MEKLCSCLSLSRFISLLLTLLLYLIAASPALAVDIILRVDASEVARCSNITPGVCCIAPRGAAGYTSITFGDLHADDIAAIWRQDVAVNPIRTNRRCTGAVLETRRGPGWWHWNIMHTAPPQGLQFAEGLYNHPATGASYVTMPKALPPDEAEANWLTMEGMFALAWGGGKWISAAQQAQSWINSAAGSSATGLMRRMKRDRVRRDVRSSYHAHAWIGPPPWQYPGSVTIDGIQYTGGSGNDLMYKDPNGNTVDLTSKFNA